MSSRLTSITADVFFFDLSEPVFARRLTRNARFWNIEKFEQLKNDRFAWDILCCNKYVWTSWGHFGHSGAILVYLEVLWITQSMLGTLRGIVNRLLRSNHWFLRGWSISGSSWEHVKLLEMLPRSPKIQRWSLDAPRISKDFQWFSMILNGFQWISKDFYGMSMIFKEFI